MGHLEFLSVSPPFLRALADPSPSPPSSGTPAEDRTRWPAAGMETGPSPDEEEGDWPALRDWCSRESPTSWEQWVPATRWRHSMDLPSPPGHSHSRLDGSLPTPPSAGSGPGSTWTSDSMPCLGSGECHPPARCTSCASDGVDATPRRSPCSPVNRSRGGLPPHPLPSQERVPCNTPQ